MKIKGIYQKNTSPKLFMKIILKVLIISILNYSFLELKKLVIIYHFYNFFNNSIRKSLKKIII